MYRYLPRTISDNARISRSRGTVSRRLCVKQTPPSPERSKPVILDHLKAVTLFLFKTKLFFHCPYPGPTENP